MVSDGGYDKKEIKSNYPELVEAMGVGNPEPVIFEEEEKPNATSVYLN